MSQPPPSPLPHVTGSLHPRCSRLFFPPRPSTPIPTFAKLVKKATKTCPGSAYQNTSTHASDMPAAFLF